VVNYVFIVDGAEIGRFKHLTFLPPQAIQRRINEYAEHHAIGDTYGIKYVPVLDYEYHKEKRRLKHKWR